VGPRLRAVAVKLIVASMLVSVFAVASFAGELPPGGTFSDDNGNVHEGNIEAIAAQGITNGCNPPANDRFCPDAVVSRGQMAALLGRALNLPATSTDFFSDDDGTLFEADINRLAAAGITRGCDPPAGDAYCPDAGVTRGEMAAFLVRAFGYSDTGGGGMFLDTSGSVFAGDIDRLATAGVTRGCNPPDNDRYCPDADVQRDQMASFLARALGLSPIVPPPVTVCDIQSAVPRTECEALVTFYNTTNGDQWTDRGGWLLDPDVCGWYGVVCEAGSITVLGLGFNKLSGPVPVELQALTGLQHLDLIQNQLTGPIPPELGNLTNLTFLSLGGNKLSGPIPPVLGDLPNLATLYLHANQLSGSIPSDLGKLPDLERLALHGNLLSGSIPSELGNLTKLRDLSLLNNELSGSIPPELGNLTNLTDFSVDNNLLTGSIPPELGNLTNLTDLSLANNLLTGSIPPELGNLTNLTVLRLRISMLSGAIPPELGNLTDLTELWLDGNQLSGSIPPELGNLSNLWTLDLGTNQLSGSIPEELGNLASINYFSLGDNALSGPVPASLLQLDDTLAFFRLNGQSGCLTASNLEVEAWLNTQDDMWNDGCAP
jgi:Leucine-rich repeat (LRR) protein